MLTEYVSDEQWKKEAVYEVGDVVYNTRTVSGDKGIYSAGSKFRICDIQASTSTRKLKEHDVSRFVTSMFLSFWLRKKQMTSFVVRLENFGCITREKKQKKTIWQSDCWQQEVCYSS